MDPGIGHVQMAYDRDPEREWRRLEGGAQDRLEYLITSCALARDLPPPDRSCLLLDAGGGPGRYTLDLAGRGYHVTLLDLSPAMLGFARDRIASADPTMRANVAGIVRGSITDLSCFPDATYDAVLCLGGPLSHLVDPDERRRGVSELTRVARPGAPLFISVMNRIGVFRGMVQWQTYGGDLRRFWKTGLSSIGINEQQVPTYFFLPEELISLIEEHGTVVERLYGCGGIGAQIQEENLLALMADPQQWPQWREVLLETCDHPGVVGVSRSLLVVARKRPSP